MHRELEHVASSSSYVESKVLHTIVSITACNLGFCLQYHLFCSTYLLTISNLLIVYHLLVIN